MSIKKKFLLNPFSLYLEQENVIAIHVLWKQIILSVVSPIPRYFLGLIIVIYRPLNLRGKDFKNFKV